MPSAPSAAFASPTIVHLVHRGIHDADENEVVPWETLNFITADVVYGGRVTDKMDKRSISSILRKVFVQENLLCEDLR